MVECADHWVSSVTAAMVVVMLLPHFGIVQTTPSSISCLPSPPSPHFPLPLPPLRSSPSFYVYHSSYDILWYRFNRFKSCCSYYCTYVGTHWCTVCLASYMSYETNSPWQQPKCYTHIDQLYVHMCLCVNVCVCVCVWVLCQPSDCCSCCDIRHDCQ